MNVWFHLVQAVLALIVGYLLCKPLLRRYDIQTKTYHGELSHWWFAASFIFVLLFSCCLYAYISS